MSRHRQGVSLRQTTNGLDDTAPAGLLYRLSIQHRTLAPDPWCYPASFMVGMLGIGMATQKESAVIKCLRIYATPDGESHFDEVELPTTKMSVHPDAAPFDVSAIYQASRVRLTRIPAGMREVAWHTVPEPNLTVRLNTRRATERCATFRRVDSCWWRTHTARAICHAIPQRRKLSSGSHYRTASICRPDSPPGHAVVADAESLISARFPL